MPTFDAEKGFNFEIEAVPTHYYFKNELLEGNKSVLLHSETGKQINTVASSYTLFNNAMFEEFARKFAESSGMTINHFGSYKGGRDVLCALENPNKELEVLGHSFTNNVLLSERRTASHAFEIGGIGTLHRCNNLFTSMDKKLSVRHASTMAENLERIMKAFSKYEVYQAKRLRRLEGLSDITFTTDDMAAFIADYQTTDVVILTPEEVRRVADGNVIGQELSTKKTNIIKGMMSSWEEESKALGANGFGAWNAATHFFTHKTKELDVAETQANWMFEQPSKMEEKIMRFAEAL